MKLRNKVLTIMLMIGLIFGLASCGSSLEEVSYDNVMSIVTVSEAEEGTDPSSYNDVLSLLGLPTGDADFDYNTKTGTLVWDDLEDNVYYVEVEFEDGDAVSVTPTEEANLYESTYTTPIGESTGVWNWIILQLGQFTFHASNLFGLLGSTYFYWLGLLIMTLTVRTVGWPIYAKTNDMTLKMQIAQPELNKIQEKYRNRQDQASQQRMQMETMEVYKKYKINVFGCLMPLLQMPIFIAMYQVVQRFPITEISLFTNDASVSMNYTFLWTNLGNTDMVTNIPLAIIVAGLMFLSQWLTQHRTKMSQKHNSGYKNPQQTQTQNSMKYMMYFMVVFMGYIALRNAGIAFYWIIGTSYQILQSYLSYKNMKTRQEKLKRQF